MHANAASKKVLLQSKFFTAMEFGGVASDAQVQTIHAAVKGSYGNSFVSQDTTQATTDAVSIFTKSD